jgi:hypothetical protein
MKKLIVLLILSLALSFAGVTSLGGIALKDVKLITAASTTSTVKLPNSYSIIELDSTSAALAYRLVTGNALTKVVTHYDANNVQTTSSVTTWTNVPAPGQIMILTCKTLVNEVSVNAASVFPTPVNSVYQFTASGQSVILYYSAGKKRWIEIGRTNSMATANLTVVDTLTTGTVNATVSILGTLGGNIAGNGKNIVNLNVVTANYASFVTASITTLSATNSVITNSTVTTASITNLGAALNTRGYAITGGSALTAGALIATTGTFTTLNIPTITVVATSAATVTTGNVNIAVKDSFGTTYYIKANASI